MCLGIGSSPDAEKHRAGDKHTPTVVRRDAVATKGGGGFGAVLHLCMLKSGTTESETSNKLVNDVHGPMAVAWVAGAYQLR